MKQSLLIFILVTAATVVHAQSQSEYLHMAAAKKRTDSIAATYGQYAAPQPQRNTSKNEKLDYNNGFREYHFGDSYFKHASELKLTLTDGDTKVYQRKAENLKANYATLTSIDYVFTNDKLSSILIKLTGKANSDLLKLAFFEQYGYDAAKNSRPNHYDWRGQKVVLSFSEATLDDENAEAMYVGLHQ